MVLLYILFSEKDRGWYIDQTCLDPQKRLEIHNRGKVRSTRYRRLWQLAYIEEYPSRQTAMKREWHLKHPKGYIEKRTIVGYLQDHRKNWPIQGPINSTD